MLIVMPIIATKLDVWGRKWEYAGCAVRIMKDYFFKEFGEGFSADMLPLRTC
jgi:hypothetical protein